MSDAGSVHFLLFPGPCAQGSAHLSLHKAAPCPQKCMPGLGVQLQMHLVMTHLLMTHLYPAPPLLLLQDNRRPAERLLEPRVFLLPPGRPRAELTSM